MECTGRMDSMHTAAGGSHFGFDLNPSALPNQDDPPAPSGNPLLDNNELQYLTTFLLGVNRSDHRNGLKMEEFQLPEGLGGVYTEDWLKPPEVVGHNVSYETVTHDGGNMFLDEADIPLGRSGSMIPTPGMGHFQQTHGLGLNFADAHTPDDLRAALALTNAGHYDMYFHQPDMSFHQPQQTHNSYSASSAQNHVSRLLANSAQQTPSPYDMAPTQHHAAGRHANQPQQTQLPHPMTTAQHQAAAAHANQLHSSQHASAQNGSEARKRAVFGTFGGNQFYNQQPRTPLDEVQFGSDPNFNRINFVPQSVKETTEAISAEQMATLGCLQRNVSAATTRAPSPTSWEPPFSSKRTNSFANPLGSLKTIPRRPPTPDESANGEPGPAGKRRKSSKLGDLGGYDESLLSSSRSSTGDTPTQEAAKRSAARKSAAKPAAKRRKLPEPIASTAAGSLKKPRRQSTAAKKAARPGSDSGSRRASKGKVPRQTLTEEEKRQNHVDSERRRRGYIGVGLDAIREVVPKVRGGGFSKAATLMATADWLEEVMAENRKLEEALRLVKMGGANGLASVAVA